MVYNTENGASLLKLAQQKKQARGKRQWILLLEIEKNEIKTLNTFQKLLGQISHSPTSVQSEQAAQRAKAIEETFMRKLLSRTRHIWKSEVYTGTIPKSSF